MADLNSWIRDIENSGLQYDDEVEGEDSDFLCFFWNWRKHPLEGEPATNSGEKAYASSAGPFREQSSVGIGDRLFRTTAPAKMSDIAEFVAKCMKWEEDRDKKLPPYSDVISLLQRPNLEWTVAAADQMDRCVKVMANDKDEDVVGYRRPRPPA